MSETCREDVLNAFIEECDPAPTEAQLAEWQARHPELAVELGEFAEAMALSPGPAWRDDGRDEEAFARSMVLVEALEAAFGFLLPRGKGRRRSRRPAASTPVITPRSRRGPAAGR